MTTFRALLVFVITTLAPVSAAVAQTTGAMLGQCANVAQTYFRDFTARTDMQYNGTRVDGTHAVNGRIFLETRSEDFACSFRPNGRRMSEFFAEGRVRNAFLPTGTPGAGSGQGAGDGTSRVTGVSANDHLNVRSGPGTSYRVIGALGNGETVRNLGCKGVGNARWCQIEMMTDMRERGWVNARYLTGAGAAPAPGAPSAGAGGTSSVRVQFAPGSKGAILYDTLAPGASRRYVLGARNGQFLDVRLETSGKRIFYQIFNPNGTFLLEQVNKDQTYRGQLWQSGDHVIEVINRTNRTRAYTAFFRIE